MRMHRLLARSLFAVALTAAPVRRPRAPTSARSRGSTSRRTTHATDATGAHAVEACLTHVCVGTSLEGPEAFLELPGLREARETALVVVRDPQGKTVARSELTATPSRFTPGGQACDFSVAQLSLALAADGTARVIARS
jgi:hypothetical protein